MGARERMLVGLTRFALGNRAVVRVIGRKRRGERDAELDPSIGAMLELQRLLRFPELDSMDPPAARTFSDAIGLVEADLAPMASVEDVAVPGPAGAIPVKLLTPPDAGASWIVYFHGGGGVIGSPASSEPATRLLAAGTKCTVASVDYRLGPEHKHPAAIEDACAAWDALAARVPPGAKLAVAGDSFGGYLSAFVDEHARRTAARRPDLQVLIYPLVDQTLASPSIERNAHGYLLTKTMIEWFRGHYMPAGADLRAASPLYWADVRGAAPAIIVVAGYDPLVDEGIAYADKLRAAGVPVVLRREGSLIHGFLSCAGAVRAARAAIDGLAAEIASQLDGPATRTGAARPG
jgi:acetyl esterase